MKKDIGVMTLLLFLLVVTLPGGAEAVTGKRSKKALDEKYQVISEESLEKAFIDYLCKSLGKDESDLAISRFKVRGNRPVQKGSLSFQLYRKERKPLQGYVRLTAVIGVDGMSAGQVKLYGWVDVFDSVVCTKRNLKKGQIVRKGDLYVARKNISHLQGNIITDMARVVGLMASHHIRGDEAIKEWMFERPPIVEKGDVVMILAETGILKVSVPGMVLEDGFLGDRVRVQNAMSRKEVYAKVINPSTVTVDF